MMGVDDTTSPELVRVEALVQARLGRRVCSLRVLRSGNGLILRGQAATYYAKQLAQHAVMEITSVPILANEIEVR